MTASLCGIPGWLLRCCSSFILKARSRSRGTEGHSSPARVTWQQEVSACGAGGFLAVPASHFRLLLIKTLSPRPAGEAFTKIESNASLRLQWKFWAAKCKPHALVCSGVTAGLLPQAPWVSASGCRPLAMVGGGHVYFWPRSFSLCVAWPSAPTVP